MPVLCPVQVLPMSQIVGQPFATLPTLLVSSELLACQGLVARCTNLLSHESRVMAAHLVGMQVLEDNAKALAAGGKMPYAKSAGRTSTPDNTSGTALKQVMPRDHA